MMNMVFLNIWKNVFGPSLMQNEMNGTIDQKAIDKTDKHREIIIKINGNQSQNKRTKESESPLISRNFDFCWMSVMLHMHVIRSSIQFSESAMHPKSVHKILSKSPTEIAHQHQSAEENQRVISKQN